MNVLHIVADDLRTELGLYNSPVQTPHLDALARRSMVFQSAYCQQPVCSPSRNSFMTGLRPDTTKAWNFIDYFREARPNAVSLPEYFKQQNNTLALGAGKMYHTTNPPNHDEPASWSAEANGSHTYFEPPWRSCPHKGTFCLDDAAPAQEDELTVQRTVAHLHRAKREGKNFYIGCGFHRPHAPYIVPERFFKLYGAPVAPVRHRTMPADVPDTACIVNFAIRYPNGTGPIPWDPKTKPVPVDVQLDVRRHYYAAISYVDSLVGDLLQALQDLDLASTTVVIFHADHGYFMGESGEWEKKMLFENTARVPLIIHDPIRPQHVRVEELAELIDVYPTAAVLAGLPMPPHVDGRDLSALSARQARADGARSSAPGAAFTQYPRCPDPRAEGITHDACINVPAAHFTFMGYSVRTLDWRYTEWRAWDGPELRGVWGPGGLVASELYNHTGHFADSAGSFDHALANLAADRALAPEIASLSAMLRAHFDTKSWDESYV